MVDDTTTVDLTAYEPEVDLGITGLGVYSKLTAETPFWWTEHDVYLAGILCAIFDDYQQARDDDASPNERAVLLKAIRDYAGELGLSPTSRGRLKLTEAQGVAAAKKIEQMDADNKRKQTAAVDIDELMGDG